MQNLKESQVQLETPERDKIVVEEVIIYELKASSVVLHVSVKGSSYIADDMALKKAKEVSTLVESLIALGIPEQEIRLKNVVAETQSGIISKSSSAKYHLSIKLRDFEKLSETLSAVTSAKSCELSSIEWKFREDRQKKLENLAKVFASAKETAECIAAALGVTIKGVHHCSYEAFAEQSMEFGRGAKFGNMYSMQNTTPDYESLASRIGSAPSLPSGQWQRQCIRAHVIFEAGKDGGCQD